MNSRTILPNRRPLETIWLEHWGMRYTVSMGCTDRNSPIAEVFIDCGKSGEQSETLASDSAVILSVALQYGTPIKALQRAITRNPDNRPSGPMGAIIDLIAGEQT